MNIPAASGVSVVSPEANGSSSTQTQGKQAPPPSFLVRCAIRVKKEDPDTFQLLGAIAGTESNGFRLFAAAMLAGFLGAVTCITSAFTDTGLGFAMIGTGVGLLEDIWKTHPNSDDQFEQTEYVDNPQDPKPYHSSFAALLSIPPLDLDVGLVKIQDGGTKRSADEEPVTVGTAARKNIDTYVKTRSVSRGNDEGHHTNVSEYVDGDDDDSFAELMALEAER